MSGFAVGGRVFAGGLADHEAQLAVAEVLDGDHGDAGVSEELSSASASRSAALVRVRVSVASRGPRPAIRSGTC